MSCAFSISTRSAVSHLSGGLLRQSFHSEANLERRLRALTFQRRDLHPVLGAHHALVGETGGAEAD